MNSIRASLVFLAFCAILAAGEEEIILTRLKGPPDSITEEFFKVEIGGRLNVEGELIRGMLLEIEEGKSHARLGVFYKNTTSKAVSPKYTIRFYNPYGIFMGGIRVPEDGVTPESLVEPGREGGKALLPRITRLDTLFRHTGMKSFPSDFFRVGWLSISDTNTNEVEQVGADQPATKPADKPPVKGQPSTPTSKDAPR